MVRFRRGGTAESRPCSRDSIAGLASEHSLASHVDRGVRIELEQEHVGVALRVGSLSQLQERRQTHVFRSGGLRKDAQGPNQLDIRSHAFTVSPSGSW